MSLKYFIGEKYKYPNEAKEFILKSTDENNFLFECGHKVSKCVFEDLIRVKTGKQVFEDLQIEINF